MFARRRLAGLLRPGPCRGPDAGPRAGFIGSGSLQNCLSLRRSSGGAGGSSLARTKEAQLAARRRIQAEQLLRHQPVAPFREAKQGTAGSAKLMVLLLRPTSPSLLRLAAGLVLSSAGVVGAHWVLYPSDPFFVLSGSFGAFVYVAAVGTSHSPLWYAGALPLLVLLALPNWPAYMRSLEGGAQGQQFVRRQHAVSLA
uniref:Uncharacterized protein n=1 Tax=Alexandrium monilatum TaxID=311494 RepID=A0A7S4W7A7_9DINO